MAKGGSLVSIIVPVFNAQPFIKLCVASILGQTYQNIEVILIDDGSTDKTPAILDAYAKIDERVRVYHTKNKGSSAARNYGIVLARGEYILFVDADDYLEFHCVENMLKVNADLVACDYHISTQVSERWLLPADTRFEPCDVRDYIRSYLKRPQGYSLFVYVWGNLFKTDIIRKRGVFFDETLRIFEDGVFITQYLRHCKSVRYVRQHLYNYVTNKRATAEFWIFHDPLTFKVAARAYCEYLKDDTLLGQACISYAIRQMIRYYSLHAQVTSRQIYEAVWKIVHDRDIQAWMESYRPGEKDSKLIPYLMKRGWVRLVMLACKWRARG